MTSLSKKDKQSLNSFLKRDNKEKVEKERAAAVAATERLKTVVRRLPANLPEEVFWQSVQQWVTDETVLWKAFCPGKPKKRINKENIPSRAYIAFKNEELVAQFSREYDGHVFRDKQGNESQAVVEFAPYQKIPADKKKVDTRNATIEKDEDYISFLASLEEAAKQEPVSIESLMAANQPPPVVKTTPLLEALKAEKSGIKDRDAILRNQYKETTILQSTSLPRNLGTTSSTKDDTSGKKKAAQPPSAVKGSDSGKKGKKAQAAAAKQLQESQTQPGAVSNITKKDPPPFKPHKVARQQAAAAKAAAAATQAQAQAQASSQLKIEDALPVSPSSSGDGTAAVAQATGSGVAAQVSAAAAASRRARPIVGLANRQLQAALSQVGASAMERKRREREAEKGASPISPDRVDNVLPAIEGTSGKGKEPERAINATSPASPGTPGAAAKEVRERSKQPPPTSPRYDRPKRKEKSGHQVDAGVKVPSIMQRPEGVPPPASQRDAPGPVLSSAVQGQAQIPVLDGPATDGPGSASGPPSRGGPRRGRGRGRGRGLRGG